MSTPLVSVCLITYKQEAYVGEALDGIVNQVQEGFTLEVVAGDDCSPDGTLSIIEKYADKHPGLIKISQRDKNLGMHGNWEKTISECQGDYIAIIEGDDRWDDNRKLAKQVALLERDKSASASFSNAKVLQSDGTFSNYDYVDKLGHDLKSDEFFTLNANPIPTCTTVFRKSMFGGFKPSYYNSPFADWILHSSLIQNGHYLYLDECSSSYRQHDEGVWSGIKKERQLLNKLKAIQIIYDMVDSVHRPTVITGRRKQLDELLYFYRENGEKLKYLKTWLQLKLAK